MQVDSPRRPLQFAMLASSSHSDSYSLPKIREDRFDWPGRSTEIDFWPSAAKKRQLQGTSTGDIFGELRSQMFNCSVCRCMFGMIHI